MAKKIDPTPAPTVAAPAPTGPTVSQADALLNTLPPEQRAAFLALLKPAPAAIVPAAIVPSLKAPVSVELTWSDGSVSVFGVGDAAVKGDEGNVGWTVTDGVDVGGYRLQLGLNVTICGKRKGVKLADYPGVVAKFGLDYPALVKAKADRDAARKAK